MRRLALPVLLMLASARAWEAADTSAVAELPVVSVKGKKQETPALEIKSDFIRKMPGVMNDPVRALAFSPGVGVANDFNARPFIRGGEADQSRIVLNGLPLLQPYHVGGSFSLFNLNTIEAVELYRDDFPVEYPGALSGILKLKGKTGRVEEPHFNANLSMIRGDVFAETPIPHTRFSVYGSAQAFLLNESLRGLLNGMSGISNDSVFKSDIEGYKNYVNLPGFQDYHWGAVFSANDRLRLEYSGGFAQDHYAVVIPSHTNIISKPDPDDNPLPVFPTTPSKEVDRSKKLSIDSVSAVGIGNHMHFLNAAWDVNEKNYLQSNMGLQFQGWDVDFKKGVQAKKPLSLDLDSRVFNYRLLNTYTPSDRHRFKYGLGYDYEFHLYRTEMPYVLYDVIANSNMDMLSTLGQFGVDGFEVVKAADGRTHFDYLGGLPARIRFSQAGWTEQHVLSLFFSHRITLESGELTYGFREEYQPEAREVVPAPRIAYRWDVDAKNQLNFRGGLYTQHNLPYYKQADHPGLKSEKSLEAGTEWKHALAPGYRFGIDAYYKHYFDLVADNLIPNGDLDLKGSLEPRPYGSMTSEDVQALKGILDTVTRFSNLPDSVQALAYQVFGDLVFDYANTGEGMAFGTEFSFFYNPHSAWNGWLSLDLSLSYRKDRKGEPYYPYQIHRPIVFNWVNEFSITNQYSLGLTYRWAMGQPYTPYSGTMDDTDAMPIAVGSRNSGRLAPYSRLDLRLSHQIDKWGTRFKTYVEVWNSMNTPNYFSRDDGTGELKSAQLNFPFPVVFVGLSADF